MHDVQNEVDVRGIEVDRVGISGLRYPIVFSDGTLCEHGMATVAVTVRLQADRRGTHMSRMVALVHDHLSVLDPRQIPQLLKTGTRDLDTSAIEVAVEIPVSTVVTAPVTSAESKLVHDLTITGLLDGQQCRVTTSVRTNVTSLCPCSKTISDYGAHNQRSEVTLAVHGDADDPYPLPVADAVDLLVRSGSAPVIPLVKRPDERALTMQAYEHPAFVEDMVRDLSAACRTRRLSHRVHVRNLESIHSHDAVAIVVSEERA